MVDGLNLMEKRYIYQIMSNIQLPELLLFPQILMHSCTQKQIVGMAKQYEKTHV